jgi:hypothetical protein
MSDELHCSDHRWSDPQPVWVFNAAGSLVKHPTDRRQFCLSCPTERTIEVSK